METNNTTYNKYTWEKNRLPKSVIFHLDHNMNKL